ncbi:unnamed protein product, partial [marine sediment metagenome]
GTGPELPVCKKAFQNIYDKTTSTLNRENKSIHESGMVVDRRSFNCPINNQYGPPLKKEEWNFLENWMKEHKKEKENQTHEQLLDACNKEAQENPDINRSYTIQNWKRCWYYRLNFKKPGPGPMFLRK